MTLKNGVFTISLDFEIYWGVRDHRTLEDYKCNLQGVQKSISETLRVFNNNDIHATWATVGFLFFESIDNLKENFPNSFPEYIKKTLSPYEYIKSIDKFDPIYHFAPKLISLILESKGQEIGTHTLSHYYCLEEGQTINNFYDDLSSVIKISKANGIATKSIVFPRNQINLEYLSALSSLGIQCYRGTEMSWMYQSPKNDIHKAFQRAFRLIDTYINISGHNVYDFHNCIKEKPFNFPASRHLRPYSKKLAIFNKAKLNRIKKSMTYAAKNNKIFHLYWHPHNFGINTSENIDFFYEIIEHFNELRDKYGMSSLNMGELADLEEKIQKL